MPGPLDGVRVVEVANWTFVPAAGAVLADLGADVVKVEPPTGGPQRALQKRLNRGVDGPPALGRLVAHADVFLTSNLAPVRAKLRIDIDDIRAVNPDIIYVRGTG